MKKKKLKANPKSERAKRRKALQHFNPPVYDEEHRIPLNNLLSPRERYILKVLSKDKTSKTNKGFEEVDFEPKWVDLIPIFIYKLEHDKEFVVKELTKLARVCDRIRQAQKNNELITFDFRYE